MISNFPHPYPDELFFSLCARYGERMRYSKKTAVAHKLFNSLSINIDFATHLDYLVKNLPPENLYLVDDFIQQNTLLPFYNPFFPTERLCKIRETMRSGGHVNFVSGLGAYKIQPPEYLRYCPSCVDEDRKHFHETYWHRLHQIKGVEVCPIHETFIEDSNFSRKGRSGYELVTAEHCLHYSSPKYIDLRNSSDSELLWLSDDISWLLSQRDLFVEWGGIRKRCLNLLFEKRMASYGGRVYVEKLLTAFTSHYSDSFLSSIGCEVNTTKRSNWLFDLIHDKKNKFSHPLHHLLLIHFLGLSIEKFLQLSEELQPFGKGPWNCFNPTCPYFNKPFIKSYKLNYGVDHSTLTGIFGCECGFIYSRKVFRKSSDTSQISKVLSFGSLWEAALRCHWEDSSLLMRDIGERLGVHQITVKTYAVKLGLPFPRVGPVKVKLTNKDRLINNSKEISCVEVNKIDTYRKDWLSLLERYPDDARVALHEKASRLGSLF